MGKGAACSLETGPEHSGEFWPSGFLSSELKGEVKSNGLNLSIHKYFSYIRLEGVKGQPVN